MGRRSTLSVPVETLASDPNGEALVIERLDGAPAWVTLSADGKTITAVPAGASGSVTFTAHIVDPGGLTADVPRSRSTSSTSPRFPTPTSTGPTTAPIAMDVLANDTDPDGDAISLQSVPATVTFTNGVTVALLVVERQHPDRSGRRRRHGDVRLRHRRRPGPAVGAVGAGDDHGEHAADGPAGRRHDAGRQRCSPSPCRPPTPTAAPW